MGRVKKNGAGGREEQFTPTFFLTLSLTEKVQLF